MSREPAARQSSAGKLADELRAAFDGSGGAAPAPTAATVPLQSSVPPAPPRSAPVRSGRGAALVAIAAVGGLALLALTLAGGGGDDGGAEPQRPGAAERAERSETRPASGQQEEGERPAESAQASADVADGRRLQLEGHALVDRDPQAAIPILRRSVDSLRGTGDVYYWYGLYDLGRALRLAGRPEEAIPVLEERLGYPNQIGTVRRELELARAAADGGSEEGEQEREKGRGKKGKGGNGDE